MKEMLLPKDKEETLNVQCVKCENFHPFTDFVNTKKVGDDGVKVRRKVCKHCTYGHLATGRDTKKSHLNAIRHRCKMKKMSFNLTIEDLEIPGLCPILQIPLKQVWGGGDNRSANYDSPSVDKIIPSLGYVKGNIQIISNRANLMKNDASIEDIRNLLKYMESNLPNS